MFYLGANDQRVTLCDDLGHEIYSTDFRNLSNVLTQLRPMIAAIALANPFGEVDKTMLKTLESEMKKNKAFHSITAIPYGANMDSRFLALIALTKAKTEKPGKAKKK
jgi:hypothetical protein